MLALTATPELQEPEPIPLTVTTPEAVRFVKIAVFGVVPPIAGGAAKSAVIPAPDTVLDALSVVNAPVFGAVEPIGDGEAKVEPFSREAFRFGTLVVDDTTSGGVGELTVEISCEPVMAFAVVIDPKPVVIEPAASAPTLVKEDPRTPAARVDPVNVPAGAGGVQLAARVQVVPFTVIDAVARAETGNPEISEFAMKPEAFASTSALAAPEAL